MNFASEQVGNLDLPGVQDIVNRLSARGSSLSPEKLVDGCLDLIGPLAVTEQTRNTLVEKASRAGPANWDGPEEQAQFARRVGEMLQLIVATREFQFA